MQAEVNRPVPKNKIYGYAIPSRAIRNRFVSHVGEILWKYKLAPETVDLPAKMSALLARRRTGGAVVLPRAACGFPFSSHLQCLFLLILFVLDTLRPTLEFRPSQ